MQTLDLTNFWQKNDLATTTAEPGVPIIDLQLKPCPFQRVANRTQKSLQLFEKVMLDRGGKVVGSGTPHLFWGYWYSKLFLEVDSFVFLAFMTFLKMNEGLAQLTLSERFCCHKWGAGIADQNMTCKSELIVCKAFFSLILPDTHRCLSIEEFREKVSIVQIEVLFDELLRSMAKSSTLQKHIVQDQQAPMLKFKEKTASKDKRREAPLIKSKQVGCADPQGMERTPSTESWYISPALGVMIQTERDDPEKNSLHYTFESCSITTTPGILELKDAEGKARKRTRPRRTYDRYHGVNVFYCNGAPSRDWKLAEFDVNLRK